MALVGTISGSNGTSNTAVTGTLVIANVNTGFPNLPSDAVLFVSGNIGGTSKAVFGGDLVVSGNADVKGDIAVVGGDLTSTAATFNIANSGVGTLNIGGGASAVNIGSASSVTSIANDLNIGGGGSKARFGTSQQLQVLWNNNAAITNTAGQFLVQQQAPNSRLELHISGTTAAGMFRVRNFTTNSSTFRELIEVRGDGTIMIGSASTGPTYLGTTTINNDLFLASNLAITGSVLATATTTTFNLLNTTLTGTLNVGGAAVSLNFGSATSTGSFSGDLSVTGRIGIGGVVERMTHTQGGNTLTCNMIGQSIFYLNNPSGDVTANFTNVPTTTDRIHTPTVILSQSATGRIVSTVQIDGVGQTINWANNVIPTGTANKQDVFGFSLIRSGSGAGTAWKVLGQMSTYG